MITEATLSSNNSAAVKEAPTEDVSTALVPDNINHAEKYGEWLEEAADVCGTAMKGDIDPTAKQAENIVPVANSQSLASQLGLEDISGAMAMIDEEEEAELNKLDEDSRQFDFTAEDIGMCSSAGQYEPALESAWIGIDNCRYNIERLELKEQDANELIMAIESAGTIDQDMARKIKERIPGALDDVNIKMFTKLPSSVGLKVAHENSLAGRIIIGTLVVAGVIFLIYKILTWTIAGIKAINKTVKKNREKARNIERLSDKVGKETFDPEAMDIEKIAKTIFNDPTVGVKSKMKAVGRQPLELRNIKWCDTKDFAHLITPLILKYLDDIDGSKITAYNYYIEQLVERVHESIVFTHEILDGVMETEGEHLNVAVIADTLNKELDFANEYIKELSIPITFSNNTNVERLKAVYEYMDSLIKPEIVTELRSAPPIQFVKELGNVHFNSLTDEFASRITVIRDTLNPKGKGTVKESDTPEQMEIRKEIIKDIAVTFMALSNVIRSVYHYTLYVESLVMSEDLFLGKVKRLTS